MPENTADKKGKLKSGFQKLMSKIGDAIEDAASLEVTTFTGDFSFKTKQVVQSGVDKFEINNVLKGMSVQNQTDINLVAYTNVKIDADVSTIVKSDLSVADKNLLDLHAQMMESSKNSRKAVIEMVTNLIK
ncbi:MAG: hypothetical protein P8100_07545 [bacterium]|jgi:hypothetical protein